MSDHTKLYLVCENKCLVEYSIDDSLTKSGSAADAAATGEGIRQAQTVAGNAQTVAGNAQTVAGNAQTVAGNAQTVADAALPKTGGTMTGPLTLQSTLTANGNIILKSGVNYFASKSSLPSSATTGTLVFVKSED